MADQTYLQYLVEQAGGKVPTNAMASLMFASGRAAEARNLGMAPLTHEQQARASKQGLAPRALRKVKWSDGKWVNLADGRDYVSPGNQFNYSALFGHPSAGAAPNTRAGKSYDDGLAHGDQPGMGTPQQPVQPPTGGSPIPRTPVDPGVFGGTRVPGQGSGVGGLPPTTPPTTPTPPAPPADGRNPVTDPPTTPNPQTPSNAWVSSPMKAFDPTQLLLALRGATNFGQNRGVNAVQENLLPWLRNAWSNARTQSGGGTGGGPGGGPGGGI